MIRRRSRSLRAAVLSLAIAGCGGSSPPPASSPDPASTSEVVIASPPAEPSASAAPEADPPAPIPRPTASAKSAKEAPEIEGTIVARQGAEITVDLTVGAPPPLETKGILSRHFEQDLGPFSTSGWLVVADVVVKKTSGGKLVLTITSEKSTIVMNGKKVDHFKIGTPVKIEVPPDPAVLKSQVHGWERE